MNSVQLAEDQGAPTSATEHRSLARWAGWMSILQGLLLFVPLIVLGAAIEWPASLGDPASVALPRLLENEGAVRIGYVAYLAYSVLFAVTVILLLRYAESRRAIGLGSLIAAFAIASTIARSIGIVRWLAPMPDLADAYSAAGSETERASIAVTFEALNSYGGTIGEVLGVSIFAALAIGLLSMATLRNRIFPAWVSVFGLIAALAVLVTAVDLLGVDPGEIVIFLGTTFVQLWFLAVGVWLLARGGRPQGDRQQP